MQAHTTITMKKIDFSLWREIEYKMNTKQASERSLSSEKKTTTKNGRLERQNSYEKWRI